MSVSICILSLCTQAVVVQYGAVWRARKQCLCTKMKIMMNNALCLCKNMKTRHEPVQKKCADDEDNTESVQKSLRAHACVITVLYLEVPLTCTYLCINVEVHVHLQVYVYKLTFARLLQLTFVLFYV